MSDHAYIYIYSTIQKFFLFF